METIEAGAEGETLSTRELRMRMVGKDISIAELARAADLYPTEVAAMLGGHRHLSASRRQRIEQAIVALGLDGPVEATPRPGEPSFTIRKPTVE